VADLAKQFDQAMLTIYRRAHAEAGYNATVFFNVLSTRGGLSPAKYLINTVQPSQGYTALHLRNRLDLTVEAMVTSRIRGCRQAAWWERREPRGSRTVL
jgi:hypothetical protein